MMGIDWSTIFEYAFSGFLIIFFLIWPLLGLSFIVSIVYRPFGFARSEFSTASDNVRNAISRYLIFKTLLAVVVALIAFPAAYFLWTTLLGAQPPNVNSPQFWPGLAFFVLVGASPLGFFLWAYQILDGADSSVRKFSSFFPEMSEEKCTLCHRNALGGRKAGDRDPELCSVHNFMRHTGRNKCPFV